MPEILLPSDTLSVFDANTPPKPGQTRCLYEIINSTIVGGIGGRSLSVAVLSRLSGDENGALRLATSPRDEISLLSLSLVSHENHRRRRLLECRSPLLLLFCSSTVSSSFTSSDTTATTSSSYVGPTFLLEPPCPLSPSIVSLTTPALPILSLLLLSSSSSFLPFSLSDSPSLSPLIPSRDLTGCIVVHAISADATRD